MSEAWIVSGFDFTSYSLRKWREFLNQSQIKPGANEDESWWEFKLSLSFALKLASTLIDFKRAQFFMRVDENFLSFVASLDELATTLVFVWPELMIVDESPH